MKKSFFTVIVISLLLVVSGGQALASMADATATLNVSSLLGIPNTTFTFDTYSAGTNGTAAVANDYANSITTGYLYSPTNISASISNASATGLIVGTPYSYYSSTSHSDNTVSPDTMSRALAGYSGTFTYNGTTPYLAHLSIPYTVRFELTASAGTAAVAYGNATSTFKFITTSANRPGLNKTMTLINEIAIETQVDNNGYLLNDTNSGIYAVDLLLFRGDQGSFNFATLAETSTSAVPLPAAIWFFGPGLAGLVGIRRRFFQ